MVKDFNHVYNKTNTEKTCIKRHICTRLYIHKETNVMTTLVYSAEPSN